MFASPYLPFVELINYLSELATPEQILAYRIPDTLQHRAEELTAKNKEGRLSEQESIEIDSLIEFDSTVTLLKMKARMSLLQHHE